MRPVAPQGGFFIIADTSDIVVPEKCVPGGRGRMMGIGVRSAGQKRRGQWEHVRVRVGRCVGSARMMGKTFLAPSVPLAPPPVSAAAGT